MSKLFKMFMALICVMQSHWVFAVENSDSGQSEIVKGSLVLNLPYCMARTLTNHLTIQQEQLFHSRIAQEVYIKEEQFIPSGFVKLAFEDEKIETVSTLSGAKLLEEDSQSMSVGVRKKFKWGTVSKVQLNRLSTDSNSTFNLFSPVYEDALQVEIVHPLLKGFGEALNTSEYRRAILAEKMAEAQLSRVIENELFKTYQLYLNLIYAYAAFNQKSAYVDFVKTENDRSKMLFESGIESTIEFEKSNQALLKAYADLQMAKVEYQKISLSILRHIQPYQKSDEMYLVIPSSIPDFYAIDTSYMPDERESIRLALERRPEIKRGKFAINQSEIDVLLAKNQQKVDVNLVSSYNSQGIGESASQSLEDITGFEYPKWYLGLEFSFLFGKFSKKAMLLQSEAGFLASRKQLQEIIAGIIYEASVSHALLNEAAAELQSARKNFEVSKHEILKSELSFQKGIVSSLETGAEVQRHSLEENNALKKALQYLIAKAGLLVAEHGFSESWVNELTSEDEVLS